MDEHVVASQAPGRARSASRSGTVLVKVALFTISLALFVLAINLMKTGARDLAPIVRDVLRVNSVANSIGFGWISAYLLMSGSPVAAAALAFFDAGAIDRLQAFGMITGSRFGASFIVLLLGFIYVLRGHDRSTSLGMGLLSLAVTDTTYLLGLLVGLALLASRTLNRFQPALAAGPSSLLDRAFEPLLRTMASLMPGWALFALGVGTIVVSFALFDRCLPEMQVKESSLGQVSLLVYSRWVMLGLGAAVTLISMSVSLSLSILVPLSDRGIIRRENVIPYIMGANITTFIDTMLAAVLLKNPAAFTVVLAEMLSISIVSLGILALGYRRYERTMLGFVDYTTRTNRHVAAFVAAILALPILLMALP